MRIKNKNLKYLILALFVFNMCPISISAKGWTEESFGFIGYFTTVKDFYFRNNGLEFHCVEYTNTRDDTNNYAITKVDTIGEDAYKNYLFENKKVEVTSFRKIYDIQVLKTTDNFTIMSSYESNGSSTFIRDTEILRDYTLHPQINKYGIQRPYRTALFEGAGTNNYYRMYMSRTYNGEDFVGIKKYNLTSTTKTLLNESSFVEDEEAGYVDATDGIEVSNNNILIGGRDKINKFYYDGSKYVLQNTTPLPVTGIQLKFFRLDNGSIFAYMHTYATEGSGCFVTIYKLDSNGNILKYYTCPYRVELYATQANAICKKDSNSFFLAANDRSDSFFTLLEFDDNLNLKQIDSITKPAKLLNYSRYSTYISTLKYANKQLYVIYGLYGLWTNGSPDSYYAVYKPIPPTATITPQYTNIGDNTPITLNIVASESYPILSIFNEDTQQGIYWGAPMNTVSYLWTGTGSINLSIRIHDSDGSLLSKGNTVTINKKDVLNNSFAIFNNNSGLQQVVIISDVDRYYENNISNRNLVNQLVSKSGGVFLIFNNVSPVLAPLLK